MGVGRVSGSLTRDALDTQAVVQGLDLPSSPSWEVGELRSGIPEQGCSKSTCCSPDTQECTLKVQDGKFKLQDLLVVWDALFADGLTLTLVDYVFVAMLLYIRDACKC